MAIDEIEDTTSGNTDTFRIPAITVTPDDNELHESGNCNQKRTKKTRINNKNCTIESDDDVILLESEQSRTVLIIDDDNELEEIHLNKSPSNSLANITRCLENSELSASQDKEQQNSDGLKSLSELPDFLFSSTQMTCEIEAISVSSAEIQESQSRAISNSLLHSEVVNRIENRRETMPETSRASDNTCDQREKPVEHVIEKDGDIEFYLQEILNDDEESQPSPAIVKINDTPIIISENGIITVIYKPEKIKFRGKMEHFKPVSNRRSSCEEQRAENATFKRKKRICDRSSNSHTNLSKNADDNKNKRHKRGRPARGTKIKIPELKKWTNKKYPPLHKVQYQGEMVYKCEDCDFAHPYSVSALRRHMILHQPAESLDWFHCHLCNYRAKRKSNLKVHMLLHRNPNDIVWFKCDRCPKKFKHKNSLNSHARRHLQRGELELYLCDKCPYKSPDKHTLLRHKINHEPNEKRELFTCTLCSYSTYNKYYLSRHRHKHGEPMYKCMLCTYEAKYKANLESHMKTHFPLDEILYCDSCDYSTNRRYTLTLHNRNVHNIYSSQEDQMYFCYNCSFQTRFKRCLVKHAQIHLEELSGGDGMLTEIKTEIETD